MPCTGASPRQDSGTFRSLGPLPFPVCSSLTTALGGPSRPPSLHAQVAKARPAPGRPLPL